MNDRQITIFKEVAKILTFIAGTGAIVWIGKQVEGSWFEIIFMK